MNLSLLLEMAAEGFGDRIALGEKKRGISFNALLELSRGGAADLAAANATALIFLDSNGEAFPVALFAAAQAGIPLVPINFRLGEEQMAALVRRHPGAVAISAPRWLPLLAATGVPGRSSGEWMADCANWATTGPSPEADGSAPAVIIYTSGTSSEPKGVVLRHQNLLSYVFGSVEFGAADAEDAALVSVPPYHIAAVANTITNIYSGRRYLVLEQFSGEEWINMVREESVTHALVVPTMLARIVSADVETAMPSLRSLAYGGAPMPTWVLEQTIATWPALDLVNAYGLTETSSTICVLGPDHHRSALASDDPDVRARLGSVGLPLPGIQVEVRGGDGEVAGTGVVGRIWVRGEQVTGEYLGKSSVLDHDGFFDTRDEGYVDAGGYLFVRGRADDTIIRGGENIAPAEIEQVILKRDDIADAVVVGLADEVWGQRIEAVVVTQPDCTVDPTELQEYVRARLRSSKTPDQVLIWDSLPRTETGKVIRREVIALIEGTRLGNATALGAEDRSS